MVTQLEVYQTSTIHFNRYAYIEISDPYFGAPNEDFLVETALITLIQCH